jgi:hypothetical protein
LVQHYGSDTRQHSQMLQEVVFMQPQFIIDVIKYVIRESRGEDVNDELRAMDLRIKSTTLRRDLEGLLERVEATRSLLTELWACQPQVWLPVQRQRCRHCKRRG